VKELEGLEAVLRREGMEVDDKVEMDGKRQVWLLQGSLPGWRMRSTGMWRQ
jgi:hypothetical protein